MRLGLDLLFLDPGVSGGRETYARELLRALRAREPGLHVTGFVNRETAAATAGRDREAAGRDREAGWWVEVCDALVALPASVRSRASWARGEIGALPRAGARAGIDLLHSPANFGPWGGPFARVLTLHDLLYRRHPELHSRAARWGTAAMVEPAARRADRILCGAESAAAEIRADLGVEAVDVVPYGAAPPRGDGDGAAARRRLGAGDRPIVLAVSSHLPHKRLEDAVAAVAAMPEPRPLLAIAGAGTEALPGGLGAVGARELEDLYAAAGALITMTTHEGFGLPVIEAMARGVPVVARDIPVLREVGGAQAAYVRGPEEAAAALAAALAEPPDAEALRARAARYTWAETARGTLEAYERALAARR